VTTTTSSSTIVESQRHARELKKSKSSKGSKSGKGGGKGGGKGKGGRKKKKHHKKHYTKQGGAQRGDHRIYRPIPRTLDKGASKFNHDKGLYGTVVVEQEPAAVVTYPALPPVTPPVTPVVVEGGGGDYHHHHHGHGNNGYYHTHAAGGGGNGGSGGTGYYGGHHTHSTTHTHSVTHSHGGNGYYNGGGGSDDDGGGGDSSVDDNGGDDNNNGSGTFRCTVVGTTDYPAYPWCPDNVVGPPPVVIDPKPADDDYYNSDDGDDNDSGTSTAPTYDGVQNYLVDMALIIDGDVADTLGRMEYYFNDDLAAFLTGHHSTRPYTGSYQIDRADFFVSQDTTSRMYLLLFCLVVACWLLVQKRSPFFFFFGCPLSAALLFFLPQTTTTTTTEPYCDNCTNADVLVHVYYTGGGGEDITVLQTAVFDAFLARCEDIRQIDGVNEMFDPCPTMRISTIHSIGYVPPPQPAPPGGGGVLVAYPPPDDTNSGAAGAMVPIVVTANSKSAAEAGLGAGGAVGIAMAGLFLLGLLAAFFAMRRRRRRNAKDRAQQQLGEDTMQDTFLTEDHKVNNVSRDDDSRFGMYPHGQTDGMVLGERSWNQDVHKCASATCKLCERRRNGLQFIPAKATMSDDTINL
jgi:hypothetical protein